MYMTELKGQKTELVNFNTSWRSHSHQWRRFSSSEPFSKRGQCFWRRKPCRCSLYPFLFLVFLRDSCLRTSTIKYFLSVFPGLVDISSIIEDHQIGIEARFQKSLLVGDSEQISRMRSDTFDSLSNRARGPVDQVANTFI